MEEVKKFCPLLGGSCLGKGCGWAKGDGK